MPRVLADLVGPRPGRRLWWAISRDCPGCSHRHIHRSDYDAIWYGRSIRRCPVSGVAYVLVPVLPKRDVA